MFVVFGEPAVSTEPGEGALDHPALGQHVKAARGGVLGDGDELAAVERLACGFDHRAGIAAVGVEDSQAGDDTLEPGQQRHGAGPILNIGRVGQNGEQEAERIDHDVALSTSHLLAGIPAARPPLSVVLTLWLSMMAADGLASRPSASRAAMRRTCSISSQTPAVMKARQYPYTVGHGGYAAGRWRHWQPVRNTCNNPSSTPRNSVVRGRPPGLAGGSIGDSSANSASLNRPPHPTSPTRCRVSGVQTITCPQHVDAGSHRLTFNLHVQAHFQNGQSGLVREILRAQLGAVIGRRRAEAGFAPEIILLPFRSLRFGSRYFEAFVEQ